MSIRPETVFRGTDARMYNEGQWMTNATEVEANVEINQSELNLLGHDWTNYRAVGKAGSGTINGLFVSTQLIEKIGETAGGEFRTELVFKNENPDTGAVYRVRLKNVTFTQIPLANASAGEVMEQEFPFNFSEYEILDRV